MAAAAPPDSLSVRLRRMLYVLRTNKCCPAACVRDLQVLER